MERDLDCRIVEDWLDGTPGAADRGALGAHLAGCPRCRERLESALEAFEASAVEAPEGLAEAVLARTAGGACERAGGLLPALVEGTLPAPDVDLVRLHLERCGACARTARALERLAAELPLLAEIRPDAPFVSEVLARTSRAPARRLRAPATLEFWRRLVMRPRLAFEGAYLGSLLLVGLFVLGGTPLREASRAALAAATTNPVRALSPPVERLLGDAGQAAREARARIEAAARRSAGTLRELWSEVQGLAPANGTPAPDRASSKGTKEAHP